MEWLPIQQMWPLLVGVACQHTGHQRMQVLELLLHIVQLYSKEGVLREKKGKVELSVLKPLWQLYTNTLREFGEGLRGGWVEQGSVYHSVWCASDEGMEGVKKLSLKALQRCR